MKPDQDQVSPYGGSRSLGVSGQSAGKAADREGLGQTPAVTIPSEISSGTEVPQREGVILPEAANGLLDSLDRLMLIDEAGELSDVFHTD